MSIVDPLQEEFELKENETLTIKPKQIHRMTAENKDCLYMESSSNHLSDVIRIEDDYSIRKTRDSQIFF